MYENTKISYCVVSRPPRPRGLCDPSSPPPPSLDINSPSFDHNYTSGSSTSPESFGSFSEEYIDNPDALLTQILNEYSNEEFPDFENITVEEDEAVSPNQILETFLQNDYADLHLFNGEVECYEPISSNISPNERPFENTNVCRIIKVSSLEPSLNRNNFLDSVIRKPKRKPKEINLEFDVPVKKSKIVPVESWLCDSTKKVGNREAAYRYRERMKVKKSVDEEELEVATKEMVEARSLMEEMRRQMATMKSLVSEMIGERLPL